jgi:hypothetical protein
MVKNLIHISVSFVIGALALVLFGCVPLADQDSIQFDRHRSTRAITQDPRAMQLNTVYSYTERLTHSVTQKIQPTKQNVQHTIDLKK